MGVSSTFNTAILFGRGPGESYKDKKLSQLYGNYTVNIEELWVDYEITQESSNRTDTRWVRLSSTSDPDISLRAHFGEQEGFGFCATHHQVNDVDKARHPFELKKSKKDWVILRLDTNHHGLGTAS
ncbi:beta galactosidase small chain [Capronia coronata CBS 617.96]|uniref:beta-galactosidase n=1 Tax=Capronia coronata CBS 617.96 TaxID=1182541 RepID=W9YMY3_9EURO|nr:beta galactosidase small chain [Capronia coronata CBS 617.96]EXJ91035.1 beta galactosidase small chain [Capronia coronata CBS 617.96]